uniref:Uncharacterized protein n=1 Tax=Lactuca sativa TaxID=4236 RepID=A0A9R1VKL8_LACSA|nr:hypothetical protein LSAT_V11C400164570 [Lactuca sativa]
MVTMIKLSLFLFSGSFSTPPLPVAAHRLYFGSVYFTLVAVVHRHVSRPGSDAGLTSLSQYPHIFSVKLRPNPVSYKIQALEAFASSLRLRHRIPYSFACYTSIAFNSSLYPNFLRPLLSTAKQRFGLLLLREEYVEEEEIIVTQTAAHLIQKIKSFL